MENNKNHAAQSNSGIATTEQKTIFQEQITPWKVGTAIFLTLVNAKHPAISKLIEKFKDEQKNTEIMVEKITAGQQIKRAKKAHYVKIDFNLYQLAHNYKPEKLLGFLIGCSYNIKL